MLSSVVVVRDNAARALSSSPRDRYERSMGIKRGSSNRRAKTNERIRTNSNESKIKDMADDLRCNEVVEDSDDSNYMPVSFFRTLVSSVVTRKNHENIITSIHAISHYDVHQPILRRKYCLVYALEWMRINAKILACSARTRFRRRLFPRVVVVRIE